MQKRKYKFSNSQLHKLKSAIKNATEANVKLSSNMIGDSNDETNFPHKLLLTDKQVPKFHEAFANNLLTIIELSKTQLSRLVQSGGFLVKRLVSFMKIGLSLVENALKPLKAC